MVPIFFKEHWRGMIFWAMAVIFCVTYFTQDNYRSVDSIQPETLRGPMQSELADKETISFSRNDFSYNLTPLYDYELSGLVVNRKDYTFFGIMKRDSVFPLDGCIIWGENISSGVYTNKSLKFWQDMRFCFWSWTGDLKVNADEVANNHFVVRDDATEEELKKIRSGDQVRIRGKLVNIVAKNTGESGKYDPEEFIWNSSTSRSDKGGGACETILVESVEIIKRGNPISIMLHALSFYGFITIVFAGIVLFILSLYRDSRNMRV